MPCTCSKFRSRLAKQANYANCRERSAAVHLLCEGSQTLDGKRVLHCSRQTLHDKQSVSTQAHSPRNQNLAILTVHPFSSTGPSICAPQKPQLIEPETSIDFRQQNQTQRNRWSARRRIVLQL